VSSANNVAVGKDAGTALSSGGEATLVGYLAGDAITTANYSTALGYQASGQVTTGDSNTSIGNNAGSSLTTGANNASLGYNANPSSATASNEVTFGNSSISSIRCAVQTISALSDARDKENVEELPLGIEFINTLRPVKFDWAMRDGFQKGVQEIGFVAQELDKAQQDANAEEYMRLVLKTNPDRLESTYGKLVPILTKAVQELSAEVEELKKKAHNKCEE